MFSVIRIAFLAIIIIHTISVLSGRKHAHYCTKPIGLASVVFML